MILLYFRVKNIRDEKRVHQPRVFSSFVYCLVCKNYPKEVYSISSLGTQRTRTVFTVPLSAKRSMMIRPKKNYFKMMLLSML